MQEERKQGILIKYKKVLIKTVLCIGILIAVTGGLYFKGQLDAEEKYENIIAELELKVEELSNPVAVYEEAATEVNIKVINSEIQEIGELATTEYLYTNAGKFEDPMQLFGKSVPFTTKSFIAKWDGIIKAGVDITKVTAEINELKKEIVIYIPEAEILSHEIDSNSIETLDQKDGLFNKVKVEDVREFDAKSKEAMEQRAIENGLLEKAYENAKGIIEKLVNNDAVKQQKYTIVFEK